MVCLDKAAQGDKEGAYGRFEAVGGGQWSYPPPAPSALPGPIRCLLGAGALPPNIGQRIATKLPSSWRDKFRGVWLRPRLSLYTVAKDGLHPLHACSGSQMGWRRATISLPTSTPTSLPASPWILGPGRLDAEARHLRLRNQQDQRQLAGRRAPDPRHQGIRTRSDQLHHPQYPRAALLCFASKDDPRPANKIGDAHKCQLPDDLAAQWACLVVGSGLSRFSSTISEHSPTHSPQRVWTMVLQVSHAVSRRGLPMSTQHRVPQICRASRALGQKPR